MRVSIAIMAHPDRAYQVEKLHAQLNRMDFYTVSTVFDNGGGEWNTGERSLRSRTDSDWHVVIQDDAIISSNFYEQVVEAITKAPYRTLISFYTGTVRPFPSKIKAAVEQAEQEHASWLHSNRLMWGVGFAIPAEHIEPMLTSIGRRHEVYDQRITVYWARQPYGVLYTYPSICSHDYTIGSLIGNDYAHEPRVAHYYEPNLFKMNDRVVEIHI